MLYFTADPHFYHEKIIQHIGRPFRDAEEMNRTLIENWNRRVRAEDEIYILGDLTLKGPMPANAVLSQLRGRKHLIRGNHDGFVSRAAFDVSQFVSVRDYAEITYQNTLLVLCHYPFLEWNESREGSISLHGHQHNPPEYNEENLRRGIRRFDVGVDANGMKPVSAEDIIAFFSLL